MRSDLGVEEESKKKEISDIQCQKQQSVPPCEPVPHPHAEQHGSHDDKHAGEHEVDIF